MINELKNGRIEKEENKIWVAEKCEKLCTDIKYDNYWNMTIQSGGWHSMGGDGFSFKQKETGPKANKRNICPRMKVHSSKSWAAMNLKDKLPGKHWLVEWDLNEIKGVPKSCYPGYGSTSLKARNLIQIIELENHSNCRTGRKVLTICINSKIGLVWCACSKEPKKKIAANYLWSTRK